MSLIEKIAQDSQKARRERDILAANLLTTLLSEAKAVGKDARNGDPTDAETVAVLRKFIKNNDEALSVLKEADPQKRQPYERERDLLTAYLPKQMSEDEIEAVVNSIVAGLPERNPKQMGVVMKALKDNHGGTYDAKIASEIVKRKLA